MRDLNIKGSFKYETDIPKRILAEIKHWQSRDDHLNGITHTLKIVFSEKIWHRRSCNGSGFPYKKGMVALFVSAAVVGVMLIIVMQKGSLSAHRARRMFPPTICPLRPQSIGCKLMLAGSAEILLIPIGIFAVTIKWMIVVAFWTLNVIWFHQRTFSFFWE